VDVQEGAIVPYLLAALIGVVAGLRAMTAPAAPTAFTEDALALGGALLITFARAPSASAWRRASEAWP